MTYRRLLVLYSGFLLLFFVLVGRIYLIASNQNYASTAKNQTVTTLSIAQTRGDFYDCDGQLLTGMQKSWYALCVPGEESYTRLFDVVNEQAQTVLYQKRNSAVPFLIEVSQDLTQEGLYCVPYTERYAKVPVAPHLLGYLNSEHEGVAGLEVALEETLGNQTAKPYVQCVTNAQGQLLEDTAPTFYEEEPTQSDVQLTLSTSVQRVAEGVASKMMTTGEILVLDTATGAVRASVSMPTFDPNALAQSLDAPDAPLLNRALQGYAVGSVFKPVLAAAAIEQDLDWFTIECEGYTEINGHVYRCANGIPHGTVNLDTALEQSCNCYFIALGQLLGGAEIAKIAQDFGFGAEIALAGSLHSAGGNMPDGDQLDNLGELANVSFGQGALLGTPLQLAAMMNTIVNEGVYRAPYVVEGVWDAEHFTLAEQWYTEKTRQVIAPQTANKLKEMLVSVVEEGIGAAAKPMFGGAGGKTGTAQTGRFDEEGNEYQDLWFAGFYPAENPKYTIVVLQDEQVQAEYASAEIFAQVCDTLYWLELPQENLETQRVE